MAESEFSWLKIASFIFVCILWVVTFVTVASGIILITEGSFTNGIMTVIGGFVCGFVSYLIYRNYQKKSRNK